MPSALRGRLMVGRLTLDQVVGVRVPAPQPHESPAPAGFSRWSGDAWVYTRDEVLPAGRRAAAARPSDLGVAHGTVAQMTRPTSAEYPSCARAVCTSQLLPSTEG